MADFAPAVDIVLREEGGYVNDPRDPGGETKYGISKRAYPNVDIAALTKADAATIYERDFWRFGGLSSQEAANLLLSFAVNAGLGAACKVLQRALRNLGAPITVDGDVGTQTVEYANKTHEHDLLAELRSLMGAHYCQIVAYHPAERAFLVGWLRRIGLIA